MNKTRNSNLELLRIITMILIVAHHFGCHSGFLFNEDTVTINRVWYQILLILGNIGNTIFVLISGYFLVNSKKFKISKVLKLMLQVFFYAFGLYLICIICGFARFDIIECIKKMFPLEIFPQYWFVSTYFMLYILSPFINVLLNKLSKEQYIKMLIITTACWCIFPTLTGSEFQRNRLIWFIYLYSIAGFIQLHCQNIKIDNKKIIRIFALLSIFILIFIVACDYIGIYVPAFRQFPIWITGLEGLPILLISITIFLFFRNMNIKNSNKINIIATATFGIYLIHDNNYIRNVLWHYIFPNAVFQDSKYFILYSIAVVFIVYVVCTIIELLRFYVLEKQYMKIIYKIEPKLENVFNRLCNMKLKDKIDLKTLIKN